MEENPIILKIRDLQSKRNARLEALVVPARAACNAMKDANMRSSADPLSQALFEFDGIDSEIKALFEADPKGTLDAILDMIRPKGN